MNVLITVLKNRFDNELYGIFKREKYAVFIAGDKMPEGIDIYIDTSDERNAGDAFDIREGLDEGVIRAVYGENVIKPMAMLEAHLTLLDAGSGKRLCFLSSAEACINETRDTVGYAYKMSKAAMHQFIQIVSNRLSPSGYTFRVYDPMRGGMCPKSAAESAFNYFTRRRGTERMNPLRDDENRVVLRDAFGREYAW
jgi:NAD(P)-dependent dehydrogenase (short-subunit alcohol dehydrogenase family)